MTIAAATGFQLRLTAMPTIRNSAVLAFVFITSADVHGCPYGLFNFNGFQHQLRPFFASRYLISLFNLMGFSRVRFFAACLWSTRYGIENSAA
jgi:hypothetical protein